MKLKECSWRAVGAWAIASSFYFYQFLLQVIPSVLKPEIQNTFHLSSQQFGAMAAYFLYAYAVMQIPAGLLLDRYGPKFLLPLATLLCAASSALLGLATSYEAAALARIFAGVGSAFAVIGCLKVAAMQFDPKHFSFMTGLTIMIGMSGAAFGQGWVGPLVHGLSRWQDIFEVFAYIGVILALAMALLIPGRPSHEIPEVKSFAVLKSELTLVLSNPCTWIAALYAGLMYVPTLGLGEAWGIAFLVEGHGLSRESAHSVLPMLFIGWALGSIVFGFLSKFLNRSGLMIGSSLLVLGLCWTMLQPGFVGILPSQWAVLFFLLGLLSAGFILAFTSAKEANPEEMAATSSGVMNTMNTLCGALAQQGIGAVLDRQLLVHHRSVAVLEDYQTALYIIVYAMVASSLFSIALHILEPYYRQKLEV